jgi:hypothetical protein
MTKIIKFPGGKGTDKNAKDQKKKIEVYNHVDEYCLMLIDSLADMGYDVDALTFQRDFTVVAQTLESCLMRSIGAKHELHPVVDALLKAMIHVDPE